MKKNILLVVALTMVLCDLKAQSFTPTRRVVLEDHTQCSADFGQFCPRGIVWLDSFMRTNLWDRAEIISVHSSIKSTGSLDDPMRDPEYSSFAQFRAHKVTSNWPSINYDRKRSNTNPDSIFHYFNQYVSDFGVADLEVELMFNESTRALDVTVNTHFAVDADNHSLALVLTEDSVHGTTPEYSQRNRYSGGALGPMKGAGIDFAKQPDPVPAELMYYRNVARAILPGYQGADGSLPATAKADSMYSYTFPTYTVPAAYNAMKMRAIVLLIDTATGQIKNANGAHLDPQRTLGVSSTKQLERIFRVYPNPVTDECAVVFALGTPEKIAIHVTDLSGKVVYRTDSQLFTQGEHSLALSLKDLPTGMYFVTLESDRGTFTEKISKSE